LLNEEEREKEGMEGLKDQIQSLPLKKRMLGMMGIKMMMLRRQMMVMMIVDGSIEWVAC
jgi:hypothetical protein